MVVVDDDDSSDDDASTTALPRELVASLLAPFSLALHLSLLATSFSLRTL